jgi:hypothetical protein
MLKLIYVNHDNIQIISSTLRYFSLLSLLLILFNLKTLSIDFHFDEIVIVDTIKFISKQKIIMIIK